MVSTQVNFRVDEEMMKAFTELRGNISQNAAIANAIEYMVKKKKLISLANPPVLEDIELTEAQKLQARIDKLEAVILRDKKLGAMLIDQDIDQDEEYNKLLIYYGMNLKSLLNANEDQLWYFYRKSKYYLYLQKYYLNADYLRIAHGRFIEGMKNRIEQIKNYKNTKTLNVDEAELYSGVKEEELTKYLETVNIFIRDQQEYYRS